VFPLEVIPTSAVGSAFIHLLISLGLVFIGVVCFGQGISAGMLWLPLILMPLMLIGLGATLLFSALGVFIRDISPLMQFGVMALMFASAVFYPASNIPPAAWKIMRFNPMLLSIETARDVMLWQRSPNMMHLGYLWIFALGACAFGSSLFRKLKPAFADVL